MKKFARILFAAVLLVFTVQSCHLGHGYDPEPVKYEVKLTVSGQTLTSATLAVEVMPEAACVVACVPAADVNQSTLADDEKLWLESVSEQYTFDKIIEKYGVSGSSSKTFSGLKPATEYIALAYAVSEDLQMLSEPQVVPFSTLEASLVKVGACIWYDDIVSDLYPAIANNGKNRYLSVDVYEYGLGSCIYYLDTPYGPDNIADWLGLSPEYIKANYKNVFWRPAYVVIDASNPDAVRMPLADLGICFNESDGWLSAGSEYSLDNRGSVQSASVGTLTDYGLITFPASGLVAKKSAADDGRVSTTNTSGSFSIRLGLD